MHSGTSLPVSVSQRYVAPLSGRLTFCEKSAAVNKTDARRTNCKNSYFFRMELASVCEVFQIFFPLDITFDLSVKPLFWLFVARAGIRHLATKQPTQPICRVFPPVSIFSYSSCRPFLCYIGGARFSCCATNRRLWDTISLYVRWLGRLSHHHPIEWTITRSTAVNEEMGLTGRTICSTFRAAQEVSLTPPQRSLCKL